MGRVVNCPVFSEKINKTGFRSNVCVIKMLENRIILKQKKSSYYQMSLILLNCILTQICRKTASQIMYKSIEQYLYGISFALSVPLRIDSEYECYERALQFTHARV